MLEGDYLQRFAEKSRGLQDASVKDVAVTGIS
jgi:hypothetical protein